MKSKIILRLLLSPFVFIWGIFLLAAGTLFPVTMLVLLSGVGFIQEPFIWALNKSGSKLEPMDPFFDITQNRALGHFLGMTVHIWGAFAIVGLYIKTGEVWTGK